MCIFMGNIPQSALLFHKEIRIASGFQIMVQNQSINLSRRGAVVKGVEHISTIV